jgi:hypothetical protein
LAYAAGRRQHEHREQFSHNRIELRIDTCGAAPSRHLPMLACAPICEDLDPGTSRETVTVVNSFV